MRQLSTILATILIGAIATAAQAEIRPGFRELIDPVAGTRFAMAKVCMAIAMKPPPDEKFFSGMPRVGSSPPYPGEVGGHYVGPGVVVLVKGDSCTVRADRGVADELRQAVLDATHPGPSKSDSGPGNRDSRGPFRQELYCLTLEGEPAFMVLSTAAGGSPPLQASIGRATSGGCAAPPSAQPAATP